MRCKKEAVDNKSEALNTAPGKRDFSLTDPGLELLSSPSESIICSSTHASKYLKRRRTNQLSGQRIYNK